MKLRAVAALGLTAALALHRRGHDVPRSGWVEGAIESGLRAARQIDPGARAEFET